MFIYNKFYNSTRQKFHKVYIQNNTVVTGWRFTSS